MTLEASGEIRKIDEERGRVFGWGYVFAKDGQPVIDHSGDVIDTPEARAALEEAFVGYVKDHRIGDLDHESFGVSTLIEAMFLSKEKAEIMGVTTDREGLWIGLEFNRDTPEGRAAWELAKKRAAFSIVGQGRREPV